MDIHTLCEIIDLQPEIKSRGLDFSKDFDFTTVENTLQFSDNRVINCTPDELNNLPLRLYDLATTGLYKRVTRLDMSAGTQFHKEYYDKLFLHQRNCFHCIRPAHAGCVLYG